MVASQRITWITLPHGLITNDGVRRARMSVFVSPQLTPDGEGTLESFDFLKWAALLERGSIEFEIEVGGRTASAAIVSTPEPALWEALFDAGTLVRPHTFDTTSRVVGTYPAARMHDVVQAAYQRASSEPLRLGGVRTALNAAFDGVQQLFRPAPAPENVDADGLSEAERAELASLVFGQPSPEKLAAHLDLLVDLAMGASATSVSPEPEAFRIVPDRSDAASALTQFMVFHQQPGGTATNQDGDEGVVVNPVDTRLDFHQRLTMVGEYPELLRLLGLVVDLEVDPADIPDATTANPGLIRVIPHVRSELSEAELHHEPDVTPRTAYIFEPGRAFAAAPRRSADGGTATVSGLLNLRLDDQYRVIQLDVDAAGLKLIELLRKVMAGGADGADEIRTLPSLRSSGVSVARHGQADMLVTAMAAGADTMAGAAAGRSTVLFEDDLIRGFRVDIGDPALGTWRSLHQRDGKYRLRGGERTLPISDEGWCQETVVQPTKAGEGAAPMSLQPALPNYVPEYLFNWQGWSLSAPRPGATLPDPKKPPAPDDVQGLGMEVELSPTKGSLPRLRFGRGYLVRARTVDLVGNGLTLEDAKPIMAELGAQAPVLPRPGAPNEFRFLRFESVPPPTAIPRVSLVPQETPAEGVAIATDVRVAGADRIVLRSDIDLTPEAFAEQHPEYALSAERHIAPPPAWQQLVEMHGLFDGSIGTKTNHEVTHRTASREERSQPKIHAAATLPVDYLPDPLAAGASFWNLPGMPNGTLGRLVNGQIQLSELPVSAELLGGERSALLIDFGTPSTWPDLASFRFRLAEGDAPPAWNAADRVLTVFLPKAEERTVRVSSYLADDAALDLLGIWRWTRQRLHDQVAQGEISEGGRLDRERELKQLTLLGLSPMQTPSRELTLVHAVLRPTGPEPILSFDPVRVGARTFAYTRGRVRVPRNSTGTVELIATWTERIDAWTANDVIAQPEDRAAEPTPITVRAPVFAGPFAVADRAEPAPPGAAGEAVPAEAFDPAGGAVEYQGPKFEELTLAVDTAVKGLDVALRGLTDEAGPHHVVAREFVNSARMRLNGAVMQFPTGPDSWAATSRVAADVRNEAKSWKDTLGGDVFPDEPPETDLHLFFPLEKIVSAADALAGQARTGVAELRRFLGRHEFGDTKYRRVSYQAVLTSRFGDDFTTPGVPNGAAPASGPDFTRVSNIVTVDIPSSMRPAPPEVVSIVPAFGWDRTSDGAERSTRRRGALRVFLARPWFTSGDGEKLGVLVLANPAVFPSFSNPITEGITLMGRDPLWTSARSPIMPGPASFPNAVSSTILGAFPNDPFNFALLAFDVAFDQAGRCFCDIDVSTGSYYPFVRLVLVRYQPNSVRGLSMSTLVVADFAQIVPERSISVSRNADNELAITVSGPTHQSPPDALGRTGNRIQVTVQRRIDGTSDDAGWLAATGFVITQHGAMPPAPILWSGTVTSPPTPVRGQHRLLIEELEPHLRVDGVPIPTERVVFVETVAI